MLKQVITNKDSKISVVVLTNESLGIKVKGISRCHDEDEYNEELGVKLANTRAWIKYYEKLRSCSLKELEIDKELKECWEDEIARLTKVIHIAETKAQEIREEYEKMIEAI